MWELITNGISLAADVSGLYTFAKGFAVDKNTPQILSSLERLEQLNERLLRDLSSSHNTLNLIAPTISRFVGHDNYVQRQHVQSVFDQMSRQIAEEIADQTRSMLAEVQQEMRTILDSVRVSHGAPGRVPSDLLRAVSHDPFAAGMTRVWDITAGGLYAVERPTILTSQFAPIAWTDVSRQRAYLGEMPLPVLGRYGFSVRPPEYRHISDGHVFSERHGLYVPFEYLLS